MNQRRGRAFILDICKDAFYLAAMVSLLWWLIPLYIAHELEVEGFQMSLVFVVSIFPLYFVSLLVVWHKKIKKMVKRQFQSIIHKSPLLFEELNRINKYTLENPALTLKAYSGVGLKDSDIPHLAQSEEDAIKAETEKAYSKALANKNKRNSYFYSLLKRGFVLSALTSIMIYLYITGILGRGAAVTFAIMGFPAVTLIILILGFWNADGPEFDYELDS